MTYATTDGSSPSSTRHSDDDELRLDREVSETTVLAVTNDPADPTRGGTQR